MKRTPNPRPIVKYHFQDEIGYDNVDVKEAFLNRSDIIRAIANAEELPTAVVDRVFSAALDIIGLSLSCGEDVNLRGFGKFEPRLRRPVTRKNPRTGIEHHVPEKTGVGFVPSPNLKARLNQS